MLTIQWTSLHEKINAGVDGLSNILESNVVNYKSKGLRDGEGMTREGRKMCYQHYGGDMPALYRQWFYHLISSLSAYELALQCCLRI